MSQSLQSILEAARQLPPNELRQLIARLLEGVAPANATDADAQANLAIVERTYGTIKGVDRETIIRLANDDEFCG